MKKPFVFALVVIFAFFAFLRLSGKSYWSPPVLTLQNMEDQISSWQGDYKALKTAKFDLEKMKEVFQFQTPSMSHLSIPYLTIMVIQLEAQTLQERRPLHLRNDVKVNRPY